MAGRKSKYYSENFGVKETKMWSTAIYIRLSQEDNDNGGNKKESNSITSQKVILQEFVEEHEDLIVYDTYIDDGYTGTDFDRPSFQRLLEDMRNGNINCVIVKDLSRLGRNYIEVGNYIEQIFPLFNIRFIAINDNIDSFENPSSTNTILVPFKNLINDEYCRDTSIKIRTALNSKRKKGEYLGAFAAYGYIKNAKDKHKLVIDEVASNIIRQIFNWYVNDGLGKIAICHRLNDLGILNPTGHKKIELGQKYNNPGICDEEYIWTPSTIRNILKNEVYIGNTVQGKRKTKSYKIHKVEEVPKEKWIRIEGTHEPIVEKELFYKAQEMNNRDIKASQTTQKLSLWAGILKCADCKRAMNKKSSVNKTGKKYEYYVCSTYRKKSNKLCTKHTIKEEVLEEVVLAAINYHMALLINTKEMIKELNKEKCKNTKDRNIKNIINLKENEISKLLNYKRALYEDWKNAYITKEEYLSYKEKYEKNVEEIYGCIEKLEKEEQKEKLENNKNNEWIENFIKNKKINKLSREIILELVDCIYIHENGNITIEFKFEVPKV